MDGEHERDKTEKDINTVSKDVVVMMIYILVAVDPITMVI